MTKILPVHDEKTFQAIESLAEIIWHQHYTPIIGRDQVVYMLGKFQSVEAMTRQVENEGYLYYSITVHDELVGYFSIKPRNDCLFLSKLYIDIRHRGKGLAKLACQTIDQFANQAKLPKIQLTVNKYNINSIAAYEKMGYRKVDEVVADIGHGYVMDDYIMEKSLA